MDFCPFNFLTCPAYHKEPKEGKEGGKEEGREEERKEGRKKGWRDGKERRHHMSLNFNICTYVLMGNIK